MTRAIRRAGLAAAVSLVAVMAQPRPAAANFDSVIYTAKQKFYAVVDELLAPIRGERTVDAVTPITPMTLVHGLESKTGSHFWQHLSDAGYELVTIDASVGIIPDVKLTFQLVRELSEADRNAIERSLDMDEVRMPGLVASIQRQIVRTLLEVSDSNEMRVGKLVIGILPLPSAEFEIEPTEAPLSEEHDSIMRYLEKQNKTVKPDLHKKAAPAPEPSASNTPTD